LGPCQSNWGLCGQVTRSKIKGGLDQRGAGGDQRTGEIIDFSKTNKVGEFTNEGGIPCGQGEILVAGWRETHNGGIGPQLWR